MLLPALGQARMTAQGASCKNNLKQQGVGLIQYGTENQDYAPWGYNSTAAIGNIGVHIYPYIAGSPYPAEYRTEKKPCIFGTFQCPTGKYKHMYGDYFVSSYGYNDSVRSLSNTRIFGYNTIAYPPGKLHAVPQPSAVFALADGRLNISTTVWGGEAYAQTAPGAVVENSDMVIIRHGKGVNITFFDGHVELTDGRPIWGDSAKANTAAGLRFWKGQ